MGGPRYSFSFVTKREAEKSRYFRGAGHGLGALGFAARTLRKRAPKNPRADGLAAARGQHSTMEWFAITIFVAYFRSFVGADACIRPRILR